MAVFPAASGNFLPPSWRNLMVDPVSVFLSMTYHLHTLYSDRILLLSTFTLKIFGLISMERNMLGKVKVLCMYVCVCVCVGGCVYQLCWSVVSKVGRYLGISIIKVFFR